jgi:methionyl-tRNA synthetase
LNKTNESSYIVTSALQYVNGVKHLGNLIGSLLPADVYTRYLKLLGKDVIYICGTDEHGTPSELSALEANMPVDQYCDEMYGVQKKIYKEFGLNFDYFGRTSDIENHKITKEIFLSLYENGYIKEKTSTQLYSVNEDRYLPDRYVNGICPHCGYENARGDQCEGCSTLLDPNELINPFSITDKTSPIEERDVRHLYIDLPALQSKVEKWVNSNDQWPTTTLTIAKKWLKQGLIERSITRNLKWGIDVPLEGYDDLVFYVWFDAPIGYISITRKWANEIVKKPELFDKYWKDKNTKLIQFMGIDNVIFHTVTWPCSILGADQGYILANDVKSFQWLTYEKGKFSTSANRGVFTDTALELYPADYWRYYLLLIAPERQETDFQWEGLQSAVNSDLNNLLGNLVNRLVSFSHKHFEGKILEINIGEKEKELQSALDACISEYRKTLDQVEFQKPLKAQRKFWQVANKYFQEKAPWTAVKSDKEDAASTLSIIAHSLRSIATLLAPFAPFTAEKIFDQLGLDSQSVHELKINEVVNWDCLVGTTLPVFKGNLFTKITDKEVEALKERYGAKEEIKDKKAKKKSKYIKKDKIKKDVEKKESVKETSGQIEYDDFAKVKFVSAVILQAEPHPNADTLLVLTVDDGRRKDRTLCAGIRKDYDPKDLIGRNVVIVDNLKPRKLRGVLSEGMVLAVDDDEGISLLKPDRQVQAGLQVS